jgi:hypothetical protein
MMRTRAGLQANSEFVPSPPDVAPRNGLARGAFENDRPGLSQLSSTTTGRALSAAGIPEVLNVCEDGTVRVCDNCLKENHNRAATEREFAFIKYNSIL